MKLAPSGREFSGIIVSPLPALPAGLIQQTKIQRIKQNGYEKDFKTLFSLFP
jgi:hypothetical protein